MRDTDFISIQGWMLKYNLSATDLILFTTIHGFSKDGIHWFHGSAQYLSEWCTLSKRRTYDALDRLVNMGLIEKREKYYDGVKLCEYRALITNDCKKMTHPSVKTSHPVTPRQGSSDAASYNNIEDNIEDNKKESRPDPEISSPTSTPSSSTTNTPAIRMKPSALRQQLATIFRAKDMTKTRSNNAISKLQSQFDDDSIIIEAAKKMKARGEIKFSDGTNWTADYFWFVNPEKTDAVVKGIIRVMKNSLVDEEKDPRTEKIHEWMLSHGYTEQDLKDPNLLLRTLKDKEYQDFVWRLNNVK